jgi:hypothetical protein
MNRKAKLITASFILIISVLSCTIFVVAQQPSNQAEVEITPANEEGYRRNGINIVNLSALLNTTNQRAFIIAHLGKGERSPRLNRRRLSCIRTMLVNSSPEKITFAEGERVNGLGRVEFYLGSELMHVALVTRNGNFCSLSEQR